MSAAVGVGSLQGTNNLAVNCPTKACRTPVKRVGVELVDRVVHIRLCATIPIPSNALAEVVGLDLSSLVAEVVSRPFPINLILDIRHQDRTADHTYAGGCLHDYLDSAEQDVKAGPDVWCFKSLVEGEFSTVGAILDRCVIGKSPTFRKR